MRLVLSHSKDTTGDHEGRSRAAFESTGNHTCCDMEIYRVLGLVLIFSFIIKNPYSENRAYRGAGMMLVSYLLSLSIIVRPQ